MASKKPKMITIGKAILYFVFALLIIYIGVKAANLPALRSPVGEGNEPALEQLRIYLPWGAGLTFGEKVMGTIGLVLGYGANEGQPIFLPVFVIALAIFLIMFVAISDIIAMFSTFSTWIAWVIGFGIATISGVAGIIKDLVVIFGITSEISAIGIGIIILSSVFAAVTLNLGLGGTVRKWRMERDVEIQAMKTEKGVGRAKAAFKGLKNLQTEMADEE